MEEPRKPLFERLPEYHRIRDAEQIPQDQLKTYLTLVEDVFSAIHENIADLYEDLFIETCDDWVIPYIGDLLGTSLLAGDPWTLRADVADTIALRRRKGTLASIERLTFNLTKWGVRAVELFERMVWNQHLNHQRPDMGGVPPYGRPGITRYTPIRGGTVSLRDPAMLSLLNTPFDPFAHVADVRPPAFGNVRYNIPNLAIFLWRLQDERVRISRPFWGGTQVQVAVESGDATRAVRFDIHPCGQPVNLFNTYIFDPNLNPPVITELDETPGPIPRARLTEDSEAGRPEKYLSVDPYDPTDIDLSSFDIADVGLQLHVPEPAFFGAVWPVPPDPDILPPLPVWTIRGGNLCAWENGVHPPVRNREIIVDPDIGRLLIGVGEPGDDAGADDAASALADDLLVTYTYGSVGAVGAHPASRSQRPEDIQGTPVDYRPVDFHQDNLGLRHALDNIHEATTPVVIEIMDSMTHELDIALIAGQVSEDGGANLLLNQPVIIRAASGQRPVIKLARPLRFRPFDPAMGSSITLTLEGLYLTRGTGFSLTDPLIARAALNRLECLQCTLDPGGYEQLDGTRSDIGLSLRLKEPYGFDATGEEAFDQTPEIVLQYTIAGLLRIDRGYRLDVKYCIIDARAGVGDDATNALALTNATHPDTDYGPPAEVEGLTVFGRMRVEQINGRGGIWVHRLEVLNDQVGCIRYSYFSGDSDRLPQNLGCVSSTEAALNFVSETFGNPAYGQLSRKSDFRIRERGPDDDAMGAFGFLLEAHKWRNLQIRFREFMPVGIRPLLIPVT